MLRELQVSARDGEPRRRWFTDKDLELFIWITRDSIIDSFQLCYVQAGSEYAFTWTREGGCSHDLIDDGEAAPVKRRTPILVSCTEALADNLLQRFVASSVDIDPEVRRVIVEQLRASAGRVLRRAGQELAVTLLGEHLSS